jgi:asparagine synthetase B (glutamine-hydrolysing)
VRDAGYKVVMTGEGSDEILGLRSLPAHMLLYNPGRDRQRSKLLAEQN